MARVLIFAKGGKALDPARYRTPDDRVVETRFPEHVARQWFAPEGIDRAFALLTEKAEAAWAELLQSGWPDEVKPEPVRIPDTASEQDLWTIFQTIGDCVSPGDEVILDITNGFRSIPLVAILAVSYIRVVKRARLMGLGYGAFEVKDAAGVSPYQDLTAMARLLDWTSAVEAFDTHGYGKSLSSLIAEVKHQAFSGAGNMPRDERPKHLDKLATQLENFTLAIETLRHQHAATAAEELDAALLQALAHDVDSRLIRPMRLLEPRIREVARPFISASPGVTLQTAMLDWLFERQMWAPYLSLLHEHLAEHLAEAFGFESVLGGHDVLGREVHLWCDQLLGAVKTYQDIAKGKADPGKIRAPGLRGTRSDDAELLEKFDRYQRFEMMTLLGSFVDVPANQDVLKLSEQIRSTRNSLMHGGLGLDPGAVTANKLRHKIEGYHAAYKALPRPLFHVDLARLEGLGVPD